MDKKALLDQHGAKVWDAITSGEALSNPKLLNPFVLCTFADLKKHTFMYWFGFPALLPVSPFTSLKDPVSVQSQLTAEQQQLLIQGLLKLQLPAVFLVVKGEEDFQVLPLSEWPQLSQEQQDKTIFGYMDPSSLEKHPGWPLRNLLMLIAHCCKRKQVTVLVFRELLRKPDVVTCEKSIMLEINMSTSGIDGSNLKVTGWEPNKRGKMGPRQVDLSALLDPIRLAEASADLNLKLMRWRQLPSLDTELLASTRCLLLGSGTLGCNVARYLLAWGIRHITFVDNSTVSYSNPVRQSLFEFRDCENGGKPKAQAAAEALRRVFPSVETSGVTLSIPMPGHPTTEESTREQYHTLMALIDSHDVVFLGTDTRESRWLPTLICAAKDKIVLNTALGFDSYLVMRHGSPMTSQRLGCYFCNDVVAPENSLRDRTLDQMCTVTRPGLAPIAAALAVELMIGLLHHAEKHHANAPEKIEEERVEAPLGAVPHQIRGFLTSFNNIVLRGQAYDRCTACSSHVLDYFKEHEFDMILQVINSPSFLEQLTGLDELRQATEDIDFDMDFDDEDEGCL